MKVSGLAFGNLESLDGSGQPIFHVGIGLGMTFAAKIPSERFPADDPFNGLLIGWTDRVNIQVHILNSSIFSELPFECSVFLFRSEKDPERLPVCLFPTQPFCQNPDPMACRSVPMSFWLMDSISFFQGIDGCFPAWYRSTGRVLAHRESPNASTRYRTNRKDPVALGMPHDKTVFWPGLLQPVRARKDFFRKILLEVLSGTSER